MVSGLKVTGDKKAAASQIKALYTLFDKSDCTMVEVRWPSLLFRTLAQSCIRLESHSCSHACSQVNPLAESTDGQLIAADAKLGFDDNAAYRQKAIFAMRDESQIDPRWGLKGRTDNVGEWRGLTCACLSAPSGDVRRACGNGVHAAAAST
jgi:succinyl-CoA synthetase beta subunit